MSFLSLLGVEFKKIRRSKNNGDFISSGTGPMATINSFNANMNFQMQAEGISPKI